MLNETVSITLDDGTITTIILPAYAVGYCELESIDGAGSLRILVRCRTSKDPSCLAAFYSARKQYPANWKRCSGAQNSRSQGFAKTDFYSVRISRSDDKTLLLELGSADGMRAAYGSPLTKGEPIKEIPVITPEEIASYFAKPSQTVTLSKQDKTRINAVV